MPQLTQAKWTVNVPPVMVLLLVSVACVLLGVLLALVFLKWVVR